MSKFELKAVLTASNKISPELKKIMQDVAKVSQRFAGVGQGLGNMAKATLPFAALGGMAAFAGKSMLDTTAQFEKFNLVLETLEGSQAKAAQSMSWISDFAAKTPYELSGVTDGFVKLKSYGIDPIEGQTLRVLGDTAAAMGKDLNQAVEALADAVTGENERLKEFGITAKKAGNQIQYAFTDKNGKQRLANARADSREQIRLTLMTIWNEKYGGAMDKLSQSWTGMWSNFQDQIARFSTMVMGSGAFEALKTQLSGILATFDKMGDTSKMKAAFGPHMASGLVDARSDLQKLAETIGGQLVVAIKEVAAAAVAMKNALFAIKELVGGWGNLFAVAAIVMAGPFVLATIQTVAAIATLGTTLLSTSIAANICTASMSALRAAALAMMLFVSVNPVILIVVAAVALLAGAAYLIYKNWGPIKAWMLNLWGSIKKYAAVAWDFIKSLFLNFTPLGLIIKNWDPIVSYFKGLWDKIKGYIEPITNAFNWKNGPVMGDVQLNGGGNGYGAMRPDNLTQGGRPSLVSASAGRVNGEINVRFDNAPQGMRVETQSKSGSVAINPDVGYRSAYLYGS